MRTEFEQIITRLTPTLKRITHRLNGHFTFFNDDDLCQEALIHLWALFLEGKLCNKTDSYILQGCYYHLKNYIRTSMDKVKTQSLESPIDDDGTTLEEVLALEKQPLEEELMNKTLYEDAQKNGLDKREMRIIKMFMEGLTVREIGKVLGISHVAVVKLRKKIGQKCRKLGREIKSSYQN